MMDIQEVLQHLPQRYPFIMIDRVLSYEPNKQLVAIKNVSANEPQFLGHFPDMPMMPGVLILEALAQASVVLANKSTTSANSATNHLHVFAGIDRARFKSVVAPGDQLILQVELIKARRDIWKMHGEARVKENIVCTAELMSATKELNHDR